MKNSILSLPLSVLLAAALLPFSVGVIASVIAGAGVIALAFCDYANEIKPLALSPVPAGTGRRNRLPLAA